MLKRIKTNSKRLLTLLLAFAIVFSTMPITAVAVTNSDGFIEIRTVEDLYNVRNDLTANYILMNDIDLTEATAEGGDWDFMGNGWNPIGSNDIYAGNAFSGEFNGNGKKIIGMRIELSTFPEGVGSVYLGLFANVTGKVHDLTFEGGSIICKKAYYQKTVYTGALAGYVLGTITNITNNMDSIHAFSYNANCYTGGIVGYANNGSTISLCNNTCPVSVGASSSSSSYSIYAGGIVGYTYNNVTISECYNTGEISSKSDTTVNKYAGGICGENYSTTGRVENCYNTGNVYGQSKASGITYGATIKNCYNVGQVSSTYVNDAKAIGYAGAGITDSYYLKGTGVNTSGATELTEAQMLLSSVYTGFDFDTVWVQNPNAVYPYPQLKNLSQDLRVIEGIELVSAPSKTVYEYGEDLDLSGCKINVIIDGAKEEVVVTKDMISGYDSKKVGSQTITISYAGNTATFNVTVKEQTFIPIYTIEDLYNIRNNLSGAYILMNDIDLTEATAEGGDWDFYGNGWNPIGSDNVYAGNAFSGAFNGNGKKIIGMRINVTSLPSGTGTPIYLGLFAKVTGDVYDLTFEGGTITSSSYTSYVGALAGYAENATFTNIVNNMDKISISSNNYKDIYVGGVVGYSDTTEFSVCINNTHVLANLNGGDSPSLVAHAGGITGFAVQGLISECYNTGKIESDGYYYYGSSYRIADPYAGGICAKADGTVITKCYNAGEIIATDVSQRAYQYSAGICNSGATVTQCYNVGQTTTSDGSRRYAIQSGGTTDCYYLADTGGSTSGATSLTESQMKTQSMYKGFDFENTWVLNPNAKYPYPQLKNNVQDLTEALSVLSIISLPFKTEYYTGDQLDLEGMAVKVIYVSGAEELINVTPDMISGFDSTTTGEQTLTLAFGGATDTFTVNVAERPTITKIEMSSQPTTTEFLVGTAFDFGGAQIKVYYDNDTTEIVDVTEDMTTGGNIHHLGNQTITVTYYGATTTFVVKVIGVSISSLRLDSKPEKLTYIEGEKLDLTGMQLVAVMTDGSENPINSNYKVTGFTGTTGLNTVTITYGGKSVSFNVEVKAKTLIDLKLQSAPNKTEYVAGQAIDTTGMVLIATYDNGEVTVVNDYIVADFDSTPGNKTVTVSYGGKSVAFNVTVVARVITEFKIASYPVKREYLQNEDLDLTGLVVKATYNDGITETVTDYQVAGFSSTAGTKTIAISYKGFVQTFTVNVNARKITHIVVNTPDKLIYNLGEEFDSTGMIVTAFYNNGQQVVVDNYTVSGFDSNVSGTKTITISYGGFTSSFSIVVNQRNGIETDGNFTVGNVVGRLSETVVVPVSVSNNIGVAGFKHTIKFNANDLEFVSAELVNAYAEGTLVVNDENATNGEVVVLWFGTEDIADNGTIYNIEFKIRETATDGKSSISINFEENDIGNISGDNLIFNSIDGFVDVRSYWLGDLNGDRIYTMVDLLQLAQYVSGKEINLTEKQKLSADVNEDGIIDIHDVVMLQQWLLVADM